MDREISMDLAAQLRELRTRAGDPSIRDLERLVARQGRKRPMARSTIQEKLSGRSSLNLTQVLSIVEALGEYARTNNTPLLPQEIDQGIWRERLTKSTENISQTPLETAPEPPQQQVNWDTEPLIQAEMFDVLEFFEASKGKPAALWLPEVLSELLQAEMSISSYLESAASETAQGVVQTVSALDQEFPRGESSGWGSPGFQMNQRNSMTVGALIVFAARKHGVTASPAIVAGLRRSQVGRYVEDYLRSIGGWHRADSIEIIVDHLRSASLPNDANRLLGHVGSQRVPDRLSRVVRYFQERERIDDRNKILKGAASSPFRIQSVVEKFNEESAPDDVLMEIARGIPYGKNAEFAQHCREAGLSHFADLIMKAAEEPPF